MSEEGKLINISDVKIDLGNLGDLSKPVHAMVNRIADAVGGFLKPNHITRLARAESEAEIIRAETRVKISEIEERGLRRLVYEEGRKQENIENITRKSIQYIKDDANPEAVDRDFFVDFFEKSKNISNEEMQDLWAKVLAQEGNSPGSISKRTLSMMAALDKKDAEMFTKLCSCVWVVSTLTPMIFEINSGPMFNDGITFDVLTHLDSIGLIKL